MQVFIDDREIRTTVAEKLVEMGAVLHSKRLLVGDFILSQRVVVERKTAADFESSIMDGRLFEQAAQMNHNFEHPVICIVGKTFERIKHKALQGAMMSLAIDMKIPIFFFNTEEELADWIFHLGEREQLRAPREQKLRFEKMPLSTNEKLQFILEGLPMIGPKNAKALLAHFGNLEKIFGAREKDLQKVKGIGKERAKEIRRLLETRYKSE